jgi:hypothetical protein
MLVIPFAAQELGDRFRFEVPNPDDYEIGKSYDAEAEDPDGPYPVVATIGGEARPRDRRHVRRRLAARRLSFAHTLLTNHAGQPVTRRHR